jgi:hypothetical protein
VDEDEPHTLKGLPVCDEEEEHVQQVVHGKVNRVGDEHDSHPHHGHFLVVGELTPLPGQEELLLAEEVDEVEPEEAYLELVHD